MKRIYLLSTIIMVLFSGLCRGEVIGKHPRVAEMEDKIARDAGLFIQSRFPNVPFLVRVEIDPLMRGLTRTTGNKGQEQLPFFDIENEELKNEWDNPEIPLLALMARIKKAVIIISLPDTVSDVEIIELRESLFSLLHLTAARDEVQILRKSWELKRFDWILFFTILISVLVFIGSSFVVNRFYLSRLASALKENGAIKQNSSVPFTGLGSHSGGGTSSTLSHKSELREIQFNDQIKIKEIMTELVEGIGKSNEFPVLFDMLELDKLGRRAHGKLGIILKEFPEHVQLRLYAYSFNSWWLDALSEPSTLDYSCVEILQKIKQYPRDTLRIDWEQLLVSVWRLDDLILPYVKSIPKEEAFSILAALPKSVSVPKAKLAFPGSWAPILEWDYDIKIPHKDRIVELMKKAIHLKPLNNYATLKRYKVERDLLEFLLTADFQDERDIYEAASNDSKIQTVRPPFYKLFDLEDNDLKTISEMISLDDWALSLNAVPIEFQRKVLQFMTDRQKYAIYEKIRNTDLRHVSREEIGLAREKIAKRIKEYLEVKNFNSVQIVNEKDILDNQKGQDDDENKNA